ncbi:piggyBac transposable element-derived protein 4-like [Schistocerca serialis cubense]|uniref:piggyBac transposable element-derived protein 4-like n=1 Tax=Schistocerca serialis cubense TaxID=2023355 RepID=UPI00214F062A|nr:piggyBac transposable element-derived protein 4-like [Schistocerca serialis cubense]
MNVVVVPFETTAPVTAALVDIPSDPDSQFDSSSDSESDVLAEDSDLDLRMKTPVLSQIISESKSEDHFDNDSDDNFSTNDDLPLSSIANFLWRKDVSAMNFAANFSEEAGVQGKLKNDSEVMQPKGGNFRPLSKAELKVFLATNILMEIKKTCYYRDCWSSHKELRDEYISSLMLVKRFSCILTHIHINDNAVMPSRESRNYDKLYKIHPLIDQILMNFKEFYAPTKEQAIDECMIYTGKIEGKVEKSLGERIVRDICKSLEGKGYHIYFDNFFTSVSLLQKLKDDRLFACETIRSHRKRLPMLKTDRELQRGEFDWSLCSDGIACIKWKDKCVVMLLSTIDSPVCVEAVSHKEKGGKITKVPCPKIVKSYNANMGCVDKADKMNSFYAIDRKSQSGASAKDFRRCVATGLVGSNVFKDSPGHPNTPSETSAKKFKTLVSHEKRISEAKHLPKYGTSRKELRFTLSSKVMTFSRQWLHLKPPCMCSVYLIERVKIEVKCEKDCQIKKTNEKLSLDLVGCGVRVERESKFDQVGYQHGGWI